ncbi:hypothetical protein F4824DRAFT_497968 [Ustulina deusta]|nr:hypothetical protein F4824DRAFT_497968 [Ustulina deusta]
MLVFLAALFYIAVQLLIFLLGMVLRMIRFIFKLVIAIVVAFLHALLDCLGSSQVIESLIRHTCAVTFLHKFAVGPPYEKNIKTGLTLRSRFPTIRWVFSPAKNSILT